jgi:hypothetical protein
VSRTSRDEASRKAPSRARTSELCTGFRLSFPHFACAIAHRLHVSSLDSNFRVAAPAPGAALTSDSSTTGISSTRTNQRLSSWFAFHVRLSSPLTCRAATLCRPAGVEAARARSTSFSTTFPALVALPRTSQRHCRLAGKCVDPVCICI